MTGNRRPARAPLSRRLALLVCGLLAAALFAPGAQAVSVFELEIDPGEIGSVSEAIQINLPADSGLVDVIDIRFSDGKKLGFPGGAPMTVSFLFNNLAGGGATSLAGFFTDENGRPIEGTGFVGIGDLDAVEVPTLGGDFPDGTEWSGILLTGPFGNENGGSAYLITWVTEPTVVPEPGTALLMGLGLAGLATRRRKSEARVSAGRL